VTKASLSLSRPLAPAPKVDQRAYPTWNALSWLFLFRLLLTALLMVVFSPVADPPLMPGGGSPHTWAALSAYATLVLASGLALYARWPSKGHQVQLAVCVDIAFFTFFMHLSGGLNSGLGLLPAISVAAGALLMEGRLSLVFASLATIGVLAEQIYNQVLLQAPSSDLTRAGLLGFTYFAVAMLAHGLYRRIRAVEQLAERRKGHIEDLYKLNDFIIRKMETGVVVIDDGLNLRLMNTAAGQLLGKTDSVGGEPLERICPPLADWVKEASVNSRQRGRRVFCVQDREIQPTLEILGSDVAKGAVIFLQDTHELAHQAQQIKLAALGKLTGSIAHNIRNPLAAISHAGQLLAESSALPIDDRHLVDIIARNAGRIDETVHSILQLSRRDQDATQNIELAAWLPDFCTDWSEGKGSPPEYLTADIGQAPLYVRADPRHLHQILSNLCDNAANHARGARPYANIQVHAGRDPNSGRALCEVRDDGPGIDAETAREMFDPFFTTSTAGTGLGLYIARELAETNAMHLTYSPRAGGGSCFRLIFAA
jgi:two-component system sensor histidine kinase PilS (NtrC family)